MPQLINERKDVLPALGEVFREYGYAGASLALISANTGLSKGSLYHFFPGGKAQMAEAVLEHIDAWFHAHVFSPLDTCRNVARGLEKMFRDVSAYFCSGARICLIGAFALNDTRDRFAARVNAYFTTWIAVLAHALRRAGLTADAAQAMAEDTIIGIQGALVLARALADSGSTKRETDTQTDGRKTDSDTNGDNGSEIFERALARLHRGLLRAIDTGASPGDPPGDPP